MHANAEIATRLKELAQSSGVELFLHPAITRDLKRTNNVKLIEASLLKMRQWKHLSPPHARPELGAVAGYHPPLSDNDAVDLLMLSAVDASAVDILVTEDKKLRRHAVSAGLGDQALSIRVRSSIWNSFLASR